MNKIITIVILGVLFTGCSSQGYLESVGVAQWHSPDGATTCYTLGTGGSGNGAAAISCLSNIPSTQQK